MQLCLRFSDWCCQFFNFIQEYSWLQKKALYLKNIMLTPKTFKSFFIKYFTWFRQIIIWYIKTFIKKKESQSLNSSSYIYSACHSPSKMGSHHCLVFSNATRQYKSTMAFKLMILKSLEC